MEIYFNPFFKSSNYVVIVPPIHTCEQSGHIIEA